MNIRYVVFVIVQLFMERKRHTALHQKDSLHIMKLFMYADG